MGKVYTHEIYMKEVYPLYQKLIPFVSESEVPPINCRRDVLDNGTQAGKESELEESVEAVEVVVN